MFRLRACGADRSKPSFRRCAQHDKHAAALPGKGYFFGVLLVLFSTINQRVTPTSMTEAQGMKCCNR